MLLSILRHLYIHFIFRLQFFLFLCVSSKFNWKPVFKSQINRAFLPTTPNRARGLFTAGLYLAYDHLVVLCFTF